MLFTASPLVMLLKAVFMPLPTPIPISENNWPMFVNNPAMPVPTPEKMLANPVVRLRNPWPE